MQFRHDLKEAIQLAFDTHETCEDTRDVALDIACVCWYDDALHIESGPNEHEMEEVGRYATPAAAFEAEGL